MSMRARNALLIVFAALLTVPLLGAASANPIANSTSQGATVIAVGPSQMGTTIVNGSFAIEPRAFFAVNGTPTITVFVIYNGLIVNTSSVTPYAIRKFTVNGHVLYLLYMTAVTTSITAFNTTISTTTPILATTSLNQTGAIQTTVPATTTTTSPSSGGIIGAIISFFRSLFGFA
jgi:hypothetical protein